MISSKDWLQAYRNWEQAILNDLNNCPISEKSFRVERAADFVEHGFLTGITDGETALSKLQFLAYLKVYGVNEVNLGKKIDLIKNRMPIGTSQAPVPQDKNLEWQLEDTPEKVQQDIEITLAMLMRKDHITKQSGHCCKSIASTLPKIAAELKIQKRLGNISIPEEADIGTFIKVNIRNENGEIYEKDTIDKAILRALSQN